jgi:cytochrome c1
MKYHIAWPDKAFADCELYASPTLANACREGAALYYLFATANASCDALVDTAAQAICHRVDGYRLSL